MKTNRKVFLLAFLAIVLVLTFTSCSDSGRGTKTAEVRVIGTAKANNTRAVASTSFGSGEVFIDGNKITDQLKPVPASDEEQQTMTSSNDQIFEADVPVSGETVSYRVDPHPGFVFDEWKIEIFAYWLQDILEMKCKQVYDTYEASQLQSMRMIYTWEYYHFVEEFSKIIESNEKVIAWIETCTK